MVQILLNFNLCLVPSIGTDKSSNNIRLVVLRFEVDRGGRFWLIDDTHSCFNVALNHTAEYVELVVGTLDSIFAVLGDCASIQNGLVVKFVEWTIGSWHGFS